VATEQVAPALAREHPSVAVWAEASAEAAAEWECIELLG
jgi:hypothetical protein